MHVLFTYYVRLSDFNIFNGVHYGSILTHHLLPFYMNDISDNLKVIKTGCVMSSLQKHIASSYSKLHYIHKLYCNIFYLFYDCNNLLMNETHRV